MVAEQPLLDEHASSDWPERVDVLAFVQREGDHWTALSLEFDIVGMGDTDDAALENMLELLSDYLHVVQQDGLSFAEARRPVPARVQIRLVSRAIRAALSARIKNAHRASVSLPLNGGPSFAA